MANELRIYPNGDWCVFRPHATGVDTGPAHYGRKPPGCDADSQIAFYRRAGYTITDQRTGSHP